MELPKRELELMQVLWKRGKAFMKDIIDEYPDPKPAPSTLATMLKRLQDKEAVAFKKYGSVREYYPLISKKSYFSSHLKSSIQNFFEGNKLQFASFFTSETNLTEEELEELKKMVDEQLKNRKS